MILIFIIALIVLIVYFVKQNNKKIYKEKYKLGEVNPDADKYCVVVDVETTGLIKDNKLRATNKNVDNFPKIVEIAWGIFSRKGEIISDGAYLIKQSEPIPKSAIKVHGITDADCNKEGYELPEVLKKFNSAVNGCIRVVGHNVMYDKRIIETECIRSGLPKPFKGMTTYDTLQMGRRHFKMGKYPKLGELYEKLAGREALLARTSHRAVDDVAMTTEIFFSLKWFGNTSYNNNRSTSKA